MEPSISSALSLLFIGMTTVFVVLALVYLTGNILIRIINLIPAEEKNIAPDNTINPNKLAAIAAAVQTITGGKGKVKNVEKVK